MANAPIVAPAYLAPDFRYAGDDWTGDNALTYVVYETAPVYAADGVTIETPGVPRPLAGCSVTGTLRYQTLRSARCVPAPGTAGVIVATGAIIDAVNGIISLSFAAAQTVFPRQSLDVFGDPSRALLIAQPKVVDASGAAITVGLQPLFVF